ncbi:hypothetical protein AD951_04090 [Acetobacter malorum]|uniref:Uncharacterized protein n=1 Tax=Acetobacter malorum TaxID=178901 RepID=A0A149UQ45_9PROT|nr:hypothetical protein [Acetobacter malorum]KXV70028.1 hypothetical protein AD951_04090 [Acetobacter malorum]
MNGEVNTDLLAAFIGSILEKNRRNGRASGVKKQGGLALFAELAGLSKTAAWSWMKNGVPRDRVDDFRALLDGNNVPYTEDEIADITSRKRPERRPNPALQEVLVAAKEQIGSRAMKKMGDMVGIPYWTLRRCADRYGGIPEDYRDNLKAACNFFHLNISGEKIDACVSDTAGASVWSLGH